MNFTKVMNFVEGYRFVWLPEQWRQLRNQPLRSFAHHDRLQIGGQKALT
jgi:hypothetical protein